MISSQNIFAKKRYTSIVARGLFGMLLFVYLGDHSYGFYFYFMKLTLTTHSRIFIRVVCRFNSGAFYMFLAEA